MIDKIDEWEDDARFTAGLVGVSIIMVVVGLIWLFGGWGLITTGVAFFVFGAAYSSYLKKIKPKSMECSHNDD